MNFRQALGFFSSAATATLAYGCSSGATEDAASADSAIYGGFPATSPRFDAIGDIAEVLDTAPDGTVTKDAKCTGVLVGPHSVLTASHCLYKYGTRNSFQYTQHYFRVGADSSKPKHEVKIVGFAAGPQVTGGLIGYGSDIAVFQLAEDILDVTPMAIGALADTDVGKSFVAIGYGRQSTTEPAGTFDVRAFGTIELVALHGDPVRAMFPSEDALRAYIAQFDATGAAALAHAIWSSPDLALLDGQQAYFSGVSDHGVQPCAGDSGGPILRRKGDAFEVVAILSGGFKDGGRCWGGEYYGLPSTAENVAFVQAQLADRSRDVALAGYCNAATAIRSTSPNEGPDPIAMVDCQSLGLVCGVADGTATCTDSLAAGPQTSCSLVGKFLHPRGAVFEFKADGTYTIRGTPFGTYTLDDGIFTFHDTISFCANTPGSYQAVFTPDCSSLTFQITQDPCEIRAEGYDSYPMPRQP